MSLPVTGATWDDAGFNDLDNNFLERGKRVQVLVRDGRGGATDISPHDSTGATLWSPFAQDGKWRGDLLAWKQVNGVWVENPDANEGWHIVGAFKDGDGPTSKPSIKNDNFMILQDDEPFDSDLVEQSEPFSLTPVETLKPLIRRLRYNLRINDPTTGVSVVENPGADDSGWGRTVGSDNIDRQFLIVRQFNRGGLPIYKAKGVARAKLNDIGNSKMDKKDSEASELTYLPLTDGHFMAMQDGEYQKIIEFTWTGGTGWTALDRSPVRQYTVTLGTQSSGTFTLTYGGLTTATIAYGATAANVKSALVALDDGYDASDWTVTGSAGGPFTVTVPGPGALTGSGASLGTPGTFVIAAVTS
jgi:hypothetical protein